MGRAAFVIALYLAATASAFGYGSIVAGNNGSSVEFLASSNQPTAQDAEAVALQDCRSQGLQECVVRQTFRGRLSRGRLKWWATISLRRGAYAVSSAAEYDRLLRRRTGSLHLDHDGLRRRPRRRSAPAAAATPDPPAQASEELCTNIGAAMAGLGVFFAWLNRYFQVWITLAVFTAAVLSIAVLRLCISVVSTAPANVLKERALICAWIVVPAATALALLPLVWIIGFFYICFFGVARVDQCFWCTHNRRALFGSWSRRAGKRQRPLSLPLAGFAFGSVATLPLILYWCYGGRLPFSSCGSSPYPLFSLCRVRTVARYMFHLSPASPHCPLRRGVASQFKSCDRPSSVWIIHPEMHHRAPAKAARADRTTAKAPLEDDVERAGQYPVPALYSGPSLEAMRLLLKRSQRSSVFGKIIFVLDARMELTRDEYDLLRKYRLGATSFTKAAAGSAARKLPKRTSK